VTDAPSAKRFISLYSNIALDVARFDVIVVTKATMTVGEISQ